MVQRIRPQVFHDSHPELPLDPDIVQPGVYKWPPHLTAGLQATVFIGGCFGTLTRYGIATTIPAYINGWPLATFIINLSGAFILGLLLQALFHSGDDKGKFRLLRLGLGTGFIGAFTTYSSLAVDTDLLVKSSHIGVAAAYALSSVIGGILFSAFGIQMATRQHKSQARNAT